MDARIVPALISHALLLAPKTRSADRDELWAAAKMEPLEAILASMQASSNTCATLLLNGEPACIFGCRYDGETGYPWMIGSDLLVQHAKPFLQLCPTWVEKMRQGVTKLENYVDARNTVAIRWLKRLGFKFDDAAPYGPLNLPFHRFTMEGKP